MAGYFDKPDHWRMRADMTRTIAAGMMDTEAKKILLDVAADYERMARRLEADGALTRRRRVALVETSRGDTDLQYKLRELQRKYRG
jgi:hypothetical protein